jgi:hypothetical protein
MNIVHKDSGADIEVDLRVKTGETKEFNIS